MQKQPKQVSLEAPMLLFAQGAIIQRYSTSKCELCPDLQWLLLVKEGFAQ